MSYVTVKVEIEGGRVVPLEPGKLPTKGTGLLTILPAAADTAKMACGSKRVELPLIHGDGKRIINPSAEDLDKSAWG